MARIPLDFSLPWRGQRAQPVTGGGMTPADMLAIMQDQRALQLHQARMRQIPQQEQLRDLQIQAARQEAAQKQLGTERAKSFQALANQHGLPTPYGMQYDLEGLGQASQAAGLLPEYNQFVKGRMSAREALAEYQDPTRGKLPNEWVMRQRAIDQPKGPEAQALAQRQAERIEESRQRGAIAGERQAETQRLLETGRRQRELGRTVAEVAGEKARNFIDTETGRAIPQGTKMQAVRDRQERGEVTQLTTQSRNQYENIRKTIPVLAQIRDDIESIYGPGGAFANLQGDERFPAAVRGFVARFRQSDPELAAAARRLYSNVDLLRRNFQGQVGTQTEGDAYRGLAGLPRLDQIPDSQAVAFSMLNTMIDAVNSSMGTILDNPQYMDKRLQRLTIDPPKGTVTQPSPAEETTAPMQPGETRRRGNAIIQRVE